MRLPGLILLAALLPGTTVAADVVTVAVASNFARTATELGVAFEREFGIEVRFSTGSTGKLYAQIVHGAPYDVFLAADADRPARLEEAGAAVTGTRFTYAQGRLVLWSRSEPDCRAVLLSGGRVAMANPETAPYGRAAREFLDAAGFWPRVESRLVYGENIAQVMHFAASGNVAVGLVAQAQLGDPRLPEPACRWQVPAAMHAPIEQQAVLLARAADHDGARAFLDYLRSPAAIALTRQHGYGGGT